MTFPKARITEEEFSRDGNAYFIMGAVARAMKREGRLQGLERRTVTDAIREYREKAKSGDYDNLLVVSVEHVEFVEDEPDLQD